MIRERIESGLKSGNIIGGNSNQQFTTRKPPSGYAKKKEGEKNVVMVSVPQYQAYMPLRRTFLIHM